MQGQVIAIGGGGFTEGRDPGLDTYVLEQAGLAKPRIGFIPTASGDSDRNVVNFYNRFCSLPCKPSHLPLFRRTSDVGEWIDEQDIIFVGGGNTKSMLAAWHAWDLPALLRRAAERGAVLSGISAGAICWFEYGVTDSVAGILSSLPGLGMIGGSCCPHYSLEPERRPTFERLVGTGEMPPGVAIDDGAAVHYTDGVAWRIISGSQGSGAYRVERKGDKAVTAGLADTEWLEVS